MKMLEKEILLFFLFFSVAGEISLQVNAVASLWKRERPVSNTTTHESHFALSNRVKYLGPAKEIKVQTAAYLSFFDK